MKIKMFLLAIFLTLSVSGLLAQNGIIKELTGTVELKLPGARDFVAAKTGDNISRDTIISTGFKSGALVEIGSAVITVRPLTRLTLTEISASETGENLNVNLRTGRVRAELNPPAGTKASMSVSGPIATASVRGTKFDFDTRNLYVERGSVAFKGNRGGLARVNAGFHGRLDNSDKIYNPVDTMISGFIPQAPVGSDLTGGAGNRIETGQDKPGTVTITPVY